MWPFFGSITSKPSTRKLFNDIPHPQWSHLFLEETTTLLTSLKRNIMNYYSGPLWDNFSRGNATIRLCVRSFIISTFQTHSPNWERFLAVLLQHILSRCGEWVPSGPFAFKGSNTHGHICIHYNHPRLCKHSQKDICWKIHTCAEWLPPLQSILHCSQCATVLHRERDVCTLCLCRESLVGRRCTQG